jgi:hypothetical protein
MPYSAAKIVSIVERAPPYDLSRHRVSSRRLNVIAHPLHAYVQGFTCYTSEVLTTGCALTAAEAAPIRPGATRARQGAARRSRGSTGLGRAIGGSAQYFIIIIYSYKKSTPDR